MIDTHAHLNFEKFVSDVDEVVNKMAMGGVFGAVVVGSDLETSRKALLLANKYDNLYAAVGIHPCHMDRVTTGWELEVEEMLKNSRVVAVGETGFDYINDSDYHPEKQRDVFKLLIELANRFEKPVILHARESTTELLEFMMISKPDFGGVLHCFCSEWELASRAIDMGLMISFTGMITYPKNDGIREVAAKLPHDRVMIETDCPYLPPQSKRGQRCEPADVVEVAKVLAEVWGKDLEYVEKVTDENARRFFKLK